MNLDSNMVMRHVEYNAIKDGKLLILNGNKQDRTGLAELYERYLEPIDSLLRRAMREAKLIDEVYNDLMLTIWRKAGRFDSDSKMSNWIFAIAYQQRMSHSRKHSKHNSLGHHDLIQDIVSGNQSSLIRTIQADLLALSALSAQYRAVIELRYFHGYSTKEIARMVRCPQNTVKTRLFHARNKLKKIIETGYTALETHS